MTRQGNTAPMPGGRLAFEACDSVLCLVLVSACAFIAAGGFYVAWQVQTDPLLLVLLPAVLTVLLVVTRRSGVAFAVGWAAFALLAIASLMWAVATAGGSSPLADEEENATVFVIVLIVCTLVVFLLSRTSVGLIVLSVVVVAEIGLIEFLYHHGYMAASLVALAALVALYLFSRMRIAYERDASVEQAQRGKPLPMSALSLGTGVLCALVAVGLAAAVIAAFNPPTGSLKLFIEERALEEIEVEGLADVTEVPDDSMTSDQTDAEIDSDKLGEDDSMAGDTARSTPSPTAALGQLLSSAFSMDTASTDFNAVSHEFPHQIWVFVVLAVVCAIVAVIVGKRLSRRRWLTAYGKLSANEQAIAAYGKVARCLEVVGLGRNDSETVAEYRDRSSSSLQSLLGPADGRSDQTGLFEELVAQFEQARYGGVPVDARQTVGFADLYREFPKRSARYLGRFRYLTRFLKI